MREYNYANELYHHGIRGMKWGVRRYQNSDGSYTAAGKRRRDRSDKTFAKAHMNDGGNSSGGKRGGMFDPTIKAGKDKAPISPAEKITRSAQNSIDGASRIHSTINDIKNSKKPQQDLSKYTDKELQQKINRMQLEQRYNELSSKNVNSGRDKVGDILAIAGSTVAIAGGAVTTIATIKGMKK